MKKGKLDSDALGSVDEYISQCPNDVQNKLKKIRTAIKEAAPNSIETVSYFQMPGYSYEGFDYNGMFVWFSFKKPYVRLHLRPPVIQNHKDKLAKYITTKAIINFPEDQEVPIALVKKLVRASIGVMKEKP